MEEIAGNGSTNSLKNICAIVEERDKTIRETDVKIEYYKNTLEKALFEIRDLEKTRKKIADRQKFFEEQLDQVESIRTSIEESQEVAVQSLINHQYLEEMANKELKTKENEKQCVEQECRNLLSEAQEKLNQNPLYRELEEQKVEFLKRDIKRRDLEVKIRQRKQIIAQKKEIEKRIFYNFFIQLAEEYLNQQRKKELEDLKVQELEVVKRLFAVQEEVKMRQKLGTSRDKIKRMTNITFGSPETRTDKSQIKVDPPQPKKETRLFNEKLNNMFQQDEPKNVLAPPKVHILSQKVILPAFEAPNFVPAEKRKNKSIDLSSKWQKLMRGSSFSKNTTNYRCSQESEKQLSQSNQQSQLSQPEQQTINTLITNKQYQSNQSSIQSAGTSKIIMQPRENQEELIEMKENIVQVQCQMVENVGSEQIGMGNSQVRTGPNHYDSRKCYIPLNENMDTNKAIVESQETQKLSMQMREKVPPVQYRAIDNMNVDCQPLNVDNSQVLFAAPTHEEHPIPSGNVMQGIISSSPNMPCTNMSVRQHEMVRNIPVSEHGKSVRFNVEETSHKSETKSMFGVQSFGNVFSSFGNRGTVKNDVLLQDQIPGATNNALNMSLPTSENSHTGLDFDSGENENHMISPEYSYEEASVQQGPFKTPEMAPRGADNFFSFGRNMFNPF